MNIDKAAMTTAFLNRSELKYHKELMSYFEQMSNHFAKKFAVNSFIREEIKQEAMIVAIKAIPKFDETRSCPFSYFFKVFHIAFMYFLRKNNNSTKKFNVCSFEVIENILEIAQEEKPETSIISINKYNLDKETLTERIQVATKLAKRAMKITDLHDRNKLIQSEIQDDFSKDFVYRYILKKDKMRRENN